MSALGESPAQTGNSSPSERSLPLFMLAFDHRRSIRGLFGIAAEPTAADAGRIAAAKLLILDGLLAARERLDSGAPAVLVDEQFGAAVLDAARDRGMVTAVACERSGQAEFQLEYGDAFAAHIERFDPTFVKALVRFNPGGDAELNERQLERLRALGDRLASTGQGAPVRAPGAARSPTSCERSATAATATTPSCGRSSSAARSRRSRTPASSPRCGRSRGIEQRSDCELIAAACRRGGRERVGCLILGRGADEAKVEHWLRVAAPVEGFEGFAVGRTIWWDAVAANLAGDLDHDAAAGAIADRYLHFVDVYSGAEGLG